jgi:endonuclease/exonuclease/phosphatase family metal-dependent hydrolase
MKTNKGATWPRARPLLEIDHAWVASRTIVDRYETFDAGISDHCGIFFDMDSASLRDR